MSPTTAGFLGICILIGLMFLRMPVGFTMAIVGFAGFAYLVSFDASTGMAVNDIFSSFGSYNLTVIPLFVFMGQLAFHAGISGRLFHAAYRIMGHWRGGLAMATIGACAGFAAICGSTNATAATMASVALPEMKKYNYRPELATGVIAAGGSLGILIPPSVIFIVYGILTEQSIGKLFISGIIPGILLSFLFCVTIWIWTYLKPDLGPRGPKTTLREKFLALIGVVETLIIFFAVIGGMFVGFFTPTEAAAVGAFATLVLALAGRNLSWQGFVQSLMETTRISCMILVIVAGATIFGHFLAITRIPFDIAAWIADLHWPSHAVMIVIILIYLIGGCFLDALALIMLTVPIFYPVVLQMGYDPIWFGVIIVLVTQMGVLTPPVGVNVYVVSGVARDVPLHVIFRGVIPLLLAIIFLALILIPFPEIALFLPRLMG
ncbi:MAG TPA: TRAP transporter large permease [Syntrophales bacterium]|jgi:tripartite ATP-independent transporter DctM subunit|nr:TRAP transporter large permease [Syntrophales bacterium]